MLSLQVTKCLIITSSPYVCVLFSHFDWAHSLVLRQDLQQLEFMPVIITVC